MTRLINPWRLWTGAFVPEWLMRREEPSAGAKLAYARLCRFAGKSGVARPFEEELGEELGVGARQARRYVAELKRLQLVDVEQRGRGLANLYRFPEHAWMGLDDDVDESPDTSDRSRADMHGRSGPDTSVRPEGTHEAGLERTHQSGPSSIPSHLKRVTEESHRDGAGVAGARAAISAALETACGHTPSTKSECAAWRNAVAQLVDVVATPEQIRVRAATYRNRWPNVTLTASAIARHWGELDTNVTALRTRPPCGQCGDTGFVEVAGGVAPCASCNLAALEAMAAAK